MHTIDYLKVKGFKVVWENEEELVIDKCPFCGKPSSIGKLHFYISKEEGLYHCKVCNAKGNLITLQKHFGDPITISRTQDFKDSKGNVVASITEPKYFPKIPSMVITKEEVLTYNKNLLQHNSISDQVRDYLSSRKITEELINSFRLGIVFRGKCTSCGFYGGLDKGRCKKCDSSVESYKLFLSIPFFDSRDNLMLVKYRTVPPDPKGFEREKGGINHLFNSNRLDFDKEDFVIIAEGELDAISLYAMGVNNVVATSSATSWESDWNYLLMDAGIVYLALDRDEAGENGALRIAQKLGTFRCKRLYFPEGIKDGNDLFVKYGKDIGILNTLMDSAKSYTDKLWLTAYDLKDSILDMVDNIDKYRGMATGFDSLDALWGGLRDSELTVLSSDTGSGKSIFTSLLAINMAMRNVPSLIGSFEVTPDAVLQRVIQQVTNNSWEELSQDKELVINAIDTIQNIPLYFLNLHGSIELDVLEDMTKWAIKRFGLRLLVLDHLHYLLPEAGTDQERNAIEKAVRRFKLWTTEWGIHIVLVVHPNSNLNAGKVHLGSLKGSTEIKKEADTIISLYRARGFETYMQNNEVNLSATEVRILKCRSTLGREGDLWFYYYPDTLRYEEIPKDYWEIVGSIDYEVLKKLKENKKESKNEIKAKFLKQYGIEYNSDTVLKMSNSSSEDSVKAIEKNNMEDTPF